MRSHLILKDVFRVIAAGPWEPETFGPVKVELSRTEEDAFFPARLVVRITDSEHPPITFDVEGYTYEAGVLRLWAGTSQFRWIFRVLQ